MAEAVSRRPITVKARIQFRVSPCEICGGQSGTATSFLRVLGWAGYIARMRASRGAYRVLVGKPEGRRPFGRPRRRWEDNIKMDLTEVGWEHELDRTGSG